MTPEMMSSSETDSGVLESSVNVIKSEITNLSSIAVILTRRMLSSLLSSLSD